MIKLENISYSYRSPSGAVPALSSVTTEIKSGITAIIGPTGSGKSTLSEILSGITAPDSGSVTLDGRPISEYKHAVGMVFQYPEYQLFAETVYDDIAYGPKNLGIADDELDLRVKTAAETVGLRPDLLSADPFSLSGGEKRLAAIAGVLAMQPSVLVLDEPAAGLDPRGRKRIFKMIQALAKADPKITIIFVTHSMDDAAEYAKDIIALRSGSIAAHGTPYEIFNNTESFGLDAPEIVKLARELKTLGINIGSAVTADEAYNALLNMLEGGNADA